MHSDCQSVVQNVNLEGREASCSRLALFVIFHCAAGLRDIDLLVDKGRDAGTGPLAARRVDLYVRICLRKFVDERYRIGLHCA